MNRVLAGFAVAPHTPMHRVNLIPSFPIGWDQFLSDFHACTAVASNEQNMHQNPSFIFGYQKPAIPECGTVGESLM
ncbi:hypothetical protein RAE03_11960, partial [Corynebacterium tuberculostearicum]